MEYDLKRSRSDKFSKEKIISELERVAKLLDYVEYSRRTFDKHANIGSNVVRKYFEKWNFALEELDKHLKMKNIKLHKRTIPANRIYSDKDLFDEMERIWNIVGQKPSRIEWDKYKSNISYQCYKKRFNGWNNACIKFIEYKSGKLIAEEAQDSSVVKKQFPKENPININKRDIPLKLRYTILKRDNFKCTKCGRSPATHLNIVLHIDHEIPFSKDGKTEINNLKTLCSECNIGKSDTI